MKRKLSKIVILVCCLGFVQPSFGQIIIMGKVTDSESGEPLAGATVSVIGETHGITTDGDGDYSIQLTSSTGRLKFSFIGYESKEIYVTGKANLNIELVPTEATLEQVVVVGYGTQKLKDLTGAISTISGSTIANRKSNQLSTALQGSMPGLMVTKNNSAPGVSSTIRVRGITTIGDSNPLIIVDGIAGGNIDDINPNDIENISVLKDAASAAIYGARAASGVILITTKRGRSEKLSITFSPEIGSETPMVNPRYVDIRRFMQMENELRWNDAGNGANEFPKHEEDIINDYYNLHINDPDQYPMTNWKDLILEKSAPRQSYSLGVSGGNNIITSRASIIYDKSAGLYDRTFDRLTARVNNDFNISKIITSAIDLNFKKSDYVSPISIPNDAIWTTPAIYPAIWQNGAIADGKTGTNPYAAYFHGGSEMSEYYKLSGRAKLSINLSNSLTVSGAIAPSFSFDKIKAFTKKVNYYSSSDPNLIGGGINGHLQANLQEKRNDSNNITYLLTSEFSKTVKLSDFNMLAGFESFQYFSENLSASRDQYLFNEFPYLDAGPLTFRNNTGNALENSYRSFFGRVDYKYDDKYLVQLNIRHDGSSRFHKNFRWGTFPSVSVGWVVSNERILQNLNFLSFMKIRGSWGQIGNERIGNYPYQTSIVTNSTVLFEGNSIVSKTTAAQQQYAIENITWEKTNTVNWGLDLNFFSNKLSLNVDYYIKTTKDMLLELEIPDYIGYDNPSQNTGRMQTKGFDVLFSWKDRKGDWSYGLAANLSDFKSKLGYLGGIEFIGDKIKIESSEFNEWYGYMSEGIFQNQEEVNNNPKLNNNIKPGDIRYRDISGPDGTPDGKISPEYDRVLLGGSLPRYLYGGVINVGYKNLQLAVTLQGVGKQLETIDNFAEPLIADWKNIPEFIDGKYWSHYNSNEQNLKAEYPRLSRTAVSNNYILSDFWLKNASYLRIKNIHLNYDLPHRLTDKLKMSNLAVFTSLSDLFSTHHFPKGWDPEWGGTGSYPLTKSIIFGFSIKY